MGGEVESTRHKEDDGCCCRVMIVLEFKKMLGENFDYFVTPIAFDVSVNMESDMFEVER